MRDEIYRTLTATREFPIKLTCPDCGDDLESFKCEKCYSNTKMKRLASSLGISSVVLFVNLFRFVEAVVLGAFCSIIGRQIKPDGGAIIGAVIGISIAGIGASWRPATSEERSLLSLANRYRSAANLDAAAICYYRWLALDRLRTVYLYDFCWFLRAYHKASSVDSALKSALCDAVVAHVCNLRSGRWADEASTYVWQAFDSAWTGSQNQQEIVHETLRYLDGETGWGIKEFQKYTSEIDKAHSSGHYYMNLDNSR